MAEERLVTQDDHMNETNVNPLPDARGAASPSPSDGSTSRKSAASSAWLSPYKTDPTATPTLSNVISLAAVGVMLVIAAWGILALTTSGSNTRGGGMAVLISTGLIVLIAGAVLVYAAMKGQSAGWFLPFTIVGAVLGIPVGIGGWGLVAYNSVPEDQMILVSESEVSSEMEIDSGGAWGYGDYEGETVLLAPDEKEIRESRTRAILDLTGVAGGEDLDFDAVLTSSELAILLRPDQMPMVNYWEMDGESFVGAQSLSIFVDDDDVDSQLQYWVDAGFSTSDYPFSEEWTGKAPHATVAFSLTLRGESAVKFVVVNDESLWGTPIVLADQSQSGEEAQSGEDAQSGTDPADQTVAPEEEN